MRATEIGGRVSAGSGSSWRSPQDVRNEDALESLKFTDSKQFILKASDIVQLQEDALRAGRDARMVVDFSRHSIRAVITFEDLP